MYQYIDNNNDIICISTGNRPREPVRVLGRGAHLAAAVRVPAAGAGVRAHTRR